MLGKMFGKDPFRVRPRHRNRCKWPAFDRLEARELLTGF